MGMFYELLKFVDRLRDSPSKINRRYAVREVIFMGIAITSINESEV